MINKQVEREKRSEREEWCDVREIWQQRGGGEDDEVSEEKEGNN